MEIGLSKLKLQAIQHGHTNSKIYVSYALASVPVKLRQSLQ